MPMTAEEFAFSLKQKYPAYRSLSNADLVSRVVAKYPQYRSEIIDLDSGSADDATPQSANSVARTLAGAGTIRATPWYQQRIQLPEMLRGTISELPSAEEAAEWLPAAAATAATMLATRNPGAAATAGGVAGEAARQLLRRAVGEPAAPGLVQEALGADPDSPRAALAGLAGEAAAGRLGALATRALRSGAGGLERSAEKGIINSTLGGAGTEREVAEASALAKRAQAAGIVSKWTHRGRLARAEEALVPARAEAEALTKAARARGTLVEGGPVLSAILDEAPSRIPAGPGGPSMERLAAAPERRAVNKVAEDTFNVLGNTGGGATGSAVPVDVALGEIEAADKLLKPMYKRGALDPAHGKTALQEGRTAWSEQLRAADKELADARLKKHELLTIKEMLQDMVDAEWNTRHSHEAAAVAGSASVGRLGPAAATIAKAVADKSSPITVPMRQILAKALSGGAHTAQIWLRALDQYGDDDAVRTAERNHKAQRALQSQAEGVVPQ